MELTMPPRMLVQSEGCTQERKKLTMVKAQAYLKAGKATKSAMLDDFCESTGYHRKYAARVLHQACQRYLLGDCILMADPSSGSRLPIMLVRKPKCAIWTGLPVHHATHTHD